LQIEERRWKGFHFTNFGTVLNWMTLSSVLHIITIEFDFVSFSMDFENQALGGRVPTQILSVTEVAAKSQGTGRDWC
jgi:hypothetical protein